MTERSSESHVVPVHHDVAHTEISRPSDADDFDVLHSEYPTASAPARRPPFMVLLLVVVALAAGIWFVMTRRAAPAVESAAQPSNPPTTETAATPLGGTPADVAVPPLDQSDALVRQLVQQLTSHPTITSWLATDGLIRNFTVVIANIADDMTPSRHLRALRPNGTFVTTMNGGRMVIDAATYRRFDSFAAAAASVDPAGAARLYSTLKPRIEEAYRDLGHPDASVDKAVETAIVELLRTPVIDGPIAVGPGSKGIGFVYADANLEGLTTPQKQLVRMGPENTRTIQHALRSIAVALGIPESRLPQERRIRAS